MAIIGLIATAIAAFIFIFLRKRNYESAHLDFYARSSHDVSSHCANSRVRYSCSATLSREWLTWMWPLYSMKQSFLNLFMKRLTRGACRSDHLRQHFLRYFGKDLLRLALARDGGGCNSGRGR